MGTFSRITAAVAALVILAAITACSSGEDDASEVILSPTTPALATTPTSTPAAAPSTTPPAPAAATDFMSFLDQHNAPIQQGNRKLAEDRGKEICTLMTFGRSAQEIQQNWEHILTAEGVKLYIEGAVTFNCPEHSGQLASL